MAFITYGIEIPEDGGTINFNGTNIETVVSNGTTVWRKYLGPSSPVTHTASKTLIAGTDFPANKTITVDIFGGGGSGGRGTYKQGGYRGRRTTTTASFDHGVSVSLTIGAGGVPPTTSGSYAGNAGGTSYFNGVAGGGGAGATESGYLGNGASYSGLGGTFKDGLNDEDRDGGQAGDFGNGANAAGYYSDGTAGGYTAGGGGSEYNHLPGYGGHGIVYIRW